MVRVYHSVRRLGSSRSLRTQTEAVSSRVDPDRDRDRRLPTVLPEVIDRMSHFVDRKKRAALRCGKEGRKEGRKEG